MQRTRTQSILGLAVLIALATSAIAQPAPAPADAAALSVTGAPALAPVATVPQTAATAAATTTTAAAVAPGDTVTMPVVKGYSYGNSNISVLFLPDQVEAMKKTLSAYESTEKAASKPTSFVDIITTPEVKEEKIEEPGTYPVFYLSSIVYDAPNDWSVWIAGYKITPRVNDTDVTVLHVGPDSATFSWKPTYAKAIDKRRESKAFAPLDPVINKVANAQPLSWNSETGTLTFTLKQNQTLALGYYTIFEGYVPSPQLGAVVEKTQDPSTTSFGGGAKESPNNGPSEAQKNDKDHKVSMNGLLNTLGTTTATPSIKESIAATPPAAVPAAAMPPVMPAPGAP